MFDRKFDDDNELKQKPLELKPLYTLSDSINDDFFEHVKFDEVSKRLIEKSVNGVKHAVVGWIPMRSTPEAHQPHQILSRSRPGLASNVTPSDIEEAKKTFGVDKFGNGLFVITNPANAGAGIVHTQTIDQVEKNEPELQNPFNSKYQYIGLSFLVVRNSTGEKLKWSNRSSKNTPSFNRDELALACLTFSPKQTNISKHEETLEYHLTRSVPKHYFTKYLQAANEDLRELKLESVYEPENCISIEMEDFWNGIMQMESAEQRRHITELLNNNVYIASSLPPDARTARSKNGYEQNLATIFYIADKYKIPLDPNYIPERFKNETNNATPLIMAAKGGYQEIAGLLIKNGADVNRPDNDGNTALFWALGRDHFETVGLLINNGADLTPNRSLAKLLPAYLMNPNRLSPQITSYVENLLAKKVEEKDPSAIDFNDYIKKVNASSHYYRTEIPEATSIMLALYSYGFKDTIDLDRSFRETLATNTTVAFSKIRYLKEKYLSGDLAIQLIPPIKAYLASIKDYLAQLSINESPNYLDNYRNYSRALLDLEVAIENLNDKNNYKNIIEEAYQTKKDVFLNVMIKASENNNITVLDELQKSDPALFIATIEKTNQSPPSLLYDAAKNDAFDAYHFLLTNGAVATPEEKIDPKYKQAKGYVNMLQMNKIALIVSDPAKLETAIKSKIDISHQLNKLIQEINEHKTDASRPTIALKFFSPDYDSKNKILINIATKMVKLLESFPYPTSNKVEFTTEEMRILSPCSLTERTEFLKGILHNKDAEFQYKMEDNLRKLFDGCIDQNLIYPALGIDYRILSTGKENNIVIQRTSTIQENGSHFYKDEKMLKDAPPEHKFSFNTSVDPKFINPAEKEKLQAFEKECYAKISQKTVRMHLPNQ